MSSAAARERLSLMRSYAATSQADGNDDCHPFGTFPERVLALSVRNVPGTARNGCQIQLSTSSSTSLIQLAVLNKTRAATVLSLTGLRIVSIAHRAAVQQPPFLLHPVPCPVGIGCNSAPLLALYFAPRPIDW